VIVAGGRGGVVGMSRRREVWWSVAASGLGVAAGQRIDRWCRFRTLLTNKNSTSCVYLPCLWFMCALHTKGKSAT
jgi:hypothetical protein